MTANVDLRALDALIEAVSQSGASELANHQKFIIDLTAVLGVSAPEYSTENTAANDYVFERTVAFKHADGSQTNGRIDCYKRDCFVLEAKQSAKRKTDVRQLSLDSGDWTVKTGHGRRGGKTWDKVMQAARRQAEDYARALPIEHGYPPFLLIVDVGNVIEVYADFSGQGKNYAHFPDRNGYRIHMEDLRDQAIQERLRTIWTDPHALDPTKISAEVTKDIAQRLANIAKGLEARLPGHEQDIAEFLMRCLFTMFAEDVGLIPDQGFETLLGEMVHAPEHFVPALESLWKTMDVGGFDAGMRATLKRFNGSLFKNSSAIKLTAGEISELHIASKRDWADVEPAIFGTLLERALDKRLRAKFGAHYTPRAYVERLVVPTIMEPLRNDWDSVQAQAEDHLQNGDEKKALNEIRAFHRKLCTTRVLDPACGTGNFLYVSLELMKRLEGEVLDAISSLGGVPNRISDFPALAFSGQVRRDEAHFSVSPAQFFGLEVNPRAVPIADLVLWIGFLKWQLRTIKVGALQEPILDAYGTIREQDALLAYDDKALARDEDGKPITVWDGITRKQHPVTGKLVPDPTARKETYTYKSPRRAVWPQAEFIVGNPPFIGGKDMRAELGDGYAEACWKARDKHLRRGADFVMHFWDEAARRLTVKNTKAAPNPLRRFGFITTNSITQTFSRRVVEHYLNAKTPLSLTYAIPDHPWLKQPDKAAVRIAMTVAQAGNREGTLATVRAEEGLNTDTPQVSLAKRQGKITAKLTLGADLSKVQPLLANEALCSPGVKLHGAGFIVDRAKALQLGLGTIEGLKKHLPEFRNGRDVAQRPRDVLVIDLFDVPADQVRDQFPQVYQHLYDHVKPERDAKVGGSKDMSEYAAKWWLFGKTRQVLRDQIDGLERWLVTVHTGKHRHFSFLKVGTLPENGLVNITLADANKLAVLSSQPHLKWTLSNCAWMGVGNDARYILSSCFNPFPFPAELPPALDQLGEELDAHRKRQLEAHDSLTMTRMYNVLERVRELDAGADVAPLDDKERAIYDAGLVGILKELHDEIDAQVFAAYGWSDLGDVLVGKPGATTPSLHKTPEQEAAEDELLARLVALNQERYAEEQRGQVRWLRPDYQIPKLGHKVPSSDELDVTAPEEIILPDARPWPKKDTDLIPNVMAILQSAKTPLAPEAVLSSFKAKKTAKRRARVEDVLVMLTLLGHARAVEGERPRYFAPR
jgi:hypothetical protein